MYKKLSLLKRDEERSDGGSSNRNECHRKKVVAIFGNSLPLRGLPLQEGEFKDNRLLNNKIYKHIGINSFNL